MSNCKIHNTADKKCSCFCQECNNLKVDCICRFLNGVTRK